MTSGADGIQQWGACVLPDLLYIVSTAKAGWANIPTQNKS